MASASAGGVEGEGPVRPWEVVFKGRVKIRAAKNTSAAVLSTKLPGSVVCGRREGNWVALEGEPGFMMISVPDGDLLLEERDETVVTVTNPATGAEIAVLQLPTTATIESLKRRLAELKGVPLHMQQLLLGTRPLVDGDSLAALDLPRELQLVRLPFDEEQGRRLLQSILHGDVPAAQEALHARARPDFESDSGLLTPLVAAAGVGSLLLVAELLAAGASIDKSGSKGPPPLMAAASCGHLKVVRYLCEMAAEVDRPMQDSSGEDAGMTPLLAAATSGHLEAVEYLCAAGADRDRSTSTGATALMLAVGGGHPQVVQGLCRARADPEKPMRDGRTPLQEAACQGHVELARSLCEAGAARDSQSHEGVTPLVWAAKCGRVEVLRYLCEILADVNRATKDGATPLLMASQNGHLGAVRCLLQAGADKDRPLDELLGGATPLVMAALNGHLEAVRCLCDAGADKDCILPNGSSALALASAKGWHEVAGYLHEA